MGRPLRLCKKNLTYHVYSSCRNKEFLMEKDEVKDMMMEVLRETQEKFDYKLKGFTIMDNHFHFVIKTVSDLHTISKIMQRIKSVFARRYNKKYGLCGPFWNDRFGSIIAEEEEEPFDYVLFLQIYMAYNSVRAGKCNDPRDYKYSSINHYLIEDYENKFGVRVYLHDAFLSLGESFKEMVKKFIQYEELYKDKLSWQS